MNDQPFIFFNSKNTGTIQAAAGRPGNKTAAIKDNRKDGTDKATVQRKIFLPMGNEEEELEAATPEKVFNLLKLDKINVSPQQAQIIQQWAGDEHERIYHAFFDMGELIKDVKKELDKVPPKNRSWKLGLDPQAFAWNKLAGKNEEGKDKRKECISNAREIIVHPKVESQVQGEWLNSSGDFPVKIIFGKDGCIHAMNILGSGRRTELLSYLDIVGVRGVITMAKEDETDVGYHLVEQLGLLYWPKKIHLSVMPISIVFQIANLENYKCTPKDSPYPWARFTMTDPKTKELQNHFVCDIKWANGAVVELLIQALSKTGITLASANLHGICGSLTKDLERGAMVVPQGGNVESLDPVKRNKKIPIRANNVKIEGGRYVVGHGHVDTIMQEDDENLWRLLNESQVKTVEMETYYFVKALEETGYKGEVKIVFTVSDVVTSHDANLGNQEARTDQTKKDRHDKNRVIIEAFGLGKSKELKV